MIVDARSLPAGHLIEADVCIVGAGVAGLTLAREFIGGPVRVCVLESGGLQPDGAAQSLCAGEIVGHPYTPLDRVRVREVGGSSNAWKYRLGWNDRRLGAKFRPLDAIDFERRDWVPHSGWPFDKAHLDPYYDRAEAVFQLGRVGYDAANWESPGNAVRLPFHGDELRTVIFKIGARDPFTTEYPRQIAEAGNISLFLHANALEIETDAPAQAVSAIRFASHGGQDLRITARAFVLAAGGIEVPRLLLLSNRIQPNGLGNQHDLVGRFFMEHPHFTLGRLVPANRRVRGSLRLYALRTVRGRRILGTVALSEAVMRRERLLNINLQMTPDAARPPAPRSVDGINSMLALRSSLYRGHRPQNIRMHLATIAREVDVIAAHAPRKARQWVDAAVSRPAVFRIGHMTEQSPNRQSRVTLSSTCDEFGQKRARLNWQLQDIDMQSVLRAHEILHANLVRSGLGGLEVVQYEEMPTPRILGGDHHMGTTRMHNDPREGVVDEHCKVHGLANLFIAGSSVFPTGGFANPTLTIGALAIRLADHIRNLAHRLPAMSERLVDVATP